MIRPTLLGAMFVLCAVPALSQPPPDYADVPYGAHPRQALDIYLPPTGTGPFPVAVWIHGGGWSSGDKSSGARAVRLAEHGIACVSINYRLSGDAPFPAPIHDCRGAVRWIRANAATYGLDPARIALWGFSAGGHLAALVGTSADEPELEGTVGGNPGLSSRVAAVVDWAGPSDLLSIGGYHNACDSPDSLMLGFCLGFVLANAADEHYAVQFASIVAASPVSHASSYDPPFLIAHGALDTTVPPAQGVRLDSVLDGVGVSSTLRIVPNSPHALPSSEETVAIQFLVAQIGSPRIPADLTGDGAVDSADLARLLSCWQVDSCGDVDFDNDTDSADLAVILEAWVG